MTLNLDKLVGSEAAYEKQIQQTLDIIKKDKDVEGITKRVILFCKYAFSLNYAQRKKYLCLKLIRDISDTIKSGFFEKILDENIPIKLLKAISNQMNNKLKQSRNQDDQQEYSERLLKLAIESINFWTKKLSYMPGKSQFSEAYQELKKMKVDIPKSYEYYKSQKLTLGLWGQKDENSEEYVKNQEMSPVLSELYQKFSQCKALIEDKISEALLNDQDLYLKAVTQKLRQFLMLFFSKYRLIEAETSIDRDVLIVYFHIINNLFKRVCARFYIPAKQMIGLTKQIFEGNNSSDFSSVDRMDIINLAGIHKYNALTIFQRIHQRIEEQETKLGPCELEVLQRDVLAYANQKVPIKKQKSNEKDQKKNPKFKR